MCIRNSINIVLSGEEQGGFPTFLEIGGDLDENPELAFYSGGKALLAIS